MGQSTWGRFVANSRRGKMKTILALALAALAAAEPEAKPEADAYYGYGYGLGGYYGGYRTYGLGYSHGLYYGKREAEAEPEAGGYRTYGLGYGYGRGLYYGKREAEAEPYYGYAAHAVAPVVSTYAAAPVVSHAVAPVAVSHAVHAVAPVVSSYAQVSPSASLSTVGIAPAAIPAVGGAYAGAGRYVANSAGTVHVAKREAEADPYYYGGYYGRGYGLGYRSYGYGLGYGLDTTGVRFCQDVLDLDATSLPTFCPWIG